jgi:excisionase family DNA binding protein
MAWLENDSILTVEEAAKMIKVSTKTIRDWLRSGQLRGLKAGKQWRILRQDLESFMQAQIRVTQQYTLQQYTLQQSTPPNETESEPQETTDRMEKTPKEPDEST